MLLASLWTLAWIDLRRRYQFWRPCRLFLFPLFRCSIFCIGRVRPVKRAIRILFLFWKRIPLSLQIIILVPWVPFYYRAASLPSVSKVIPLFLLDFRAIYCFMPLTRRFVHFITFGKRNVLALYTLYSNFEQRNDINDLYLSIEKHHYFFRVLLPFPSPSYFRQPALITRIKNETWFCRKFEKCPSSAQNRPPFPL